MNKPKLLFVYDHPNELRWCDGLFKALELLEEDFEIKKVNLSTYKLYTIGLDEKCDFILGWGAFNSQVDKVIQNIKIAGKKGLCIAGNAFPPKGANNYDVLFYETKYYRPQINFHKNIVHAFGINSEIFNKEPITAPIGEIKFATPIVFDYIGVGALAKWKRWGKMKDKKGIRLVIGEYQKGNEQESGEIAKDLLRNGVMVSDNIHPLDLANFYRWSRYCYIPADIYGGGERAVMEAKASGCLVEIENDNPKLKEILEGPILDEHYYAEQLKKGVMSVL